LDRSLFHFPSLETFLWILASIAAFVALLVFIPSFNVLAVSSTPTTTVTLTPRPTLTPIPSSTQIAIPPSPRPLSTVLFPTDSSNSKTLVISADPTKTGWYSSGESSPHLGDRNLHAGSYKGQTFQSIVAFDLSALAPGSKILYAQVELVGLNRTNLGVGGKWTLQLLSSTASTPNADLRAVAAQANIGTALTADQLNEGQVNRFVFSADQNTNLEEALTGDGRVYFRLSSISSGGDDLFTWDAGDRDVPSSRPILRLIAVPTAFAVITNTPTPENVFTAAAILYKGTEIAQRGTPTSFSRRFATATPQIVITPAPTPANPETATSIVALATAVAATTGTYTPTPVNFVTATPGSIPPTPTPPTPMFVPIDKLPTVPIPTPPLTRFQLAHKPLPQGLQGKIMFLSGSRDNPQVFMMDSSGKNIVLVTNREVYDIAAARDAFSPNGIIESFNGADPNNRDVLQIFLFDYSFPGTPNNPLYNQVTYLKRGIAFSPSWSPDSGKIAYTSTESGFHEIYVLDLGAKRTTQLTSSKGWSWNQFPSWSADGKQIVYASDRARPNTFTDIWVMSSVDGSNAFRLLDWGRDSWGPIWIKWNQ
jgi:WD40 repeat protein